MFVDTHCHLNMMVKTEFDTLLKPEHFVLVHDIIEQAKRAGVTQIINVGTSLPESMNSVALAQHFDNVYATVGLHPCDCTPTWRKDFEDIVRLVKNKEENKIKAIGEVGLDFYHKPFDAQRQVDAFKAQIELALEYNLPLVIHVRDAGEELLRVLEEYVKEIKGATIHCFSQKQDFADIVVGWGFYIGIDGPITYPKNDELRSIVKATPLEHIILETDAPFLPPQQYRGKQNSPVYLPLFAQTIADLKGVSLEELARQTTANATKLFDL
ncbi:TatD family hydrolase [Candidatus Babeliales bacterium]|nr:TatD family hydrolase [Candidatus Babeliales bacterium]